jgi:hypothetical protein
MEKRMFLHDEEAASTLTQTWDFCLDSFAIGRFGHLVVERGLEHVGSTNWMTEQECLDPVEDRIVSTQRSGRWRSVVVDLDEAVADGCVALVSLSHGSIHVRVAGRATEDVVAARAWLRERFPVTEPTEAQRIWITFWSLSERGAARQNMREIEVPTWAEVVANYPDAVGRKLEALMSEGFVPAKGGRLLLWHGPLGTGKTFALRALAWEWRSWCAFHYVTDPESFFGSSPSYMLNVLLDSDDEDADEDRWRLLILEDTGELLAADAKERTGQGLSRLLNTVDGLIGQGLRVLVLVTTNETLKSLHPAVSRPGRCASQVEFTEFPPDEAADWLARRGGEGHGQGATLASLFAGEAGIEQPEPRKIGFVR